MLERLEIRESNFSKTIDNKDFRIDSQFYTQEPKKNSSLVYDKIGNVIEKAQYGVSISMNEDDLGFPIYRMNEIHSMMCDLEVSKYAEITNNELETFRLNDKDVLFNRTNSFEWVGRTGLYRKIDDRDFVFASYLVRFVPNTKIILPEYLTAFLSSKHGVWDIKRRARQSINQTNVNPEEVKNIDIPILSFAIQNAIKKCFDIAHECRILSDSKYSEAKELLLQEIGLYNFEPSKESVNIKSFKESFKTSERLDAEYYQKKYEDIEMIVKQNGFYKIIEVFDLLSNSSPSSYTDTGTRVIKTKNIRIPTIDIKNITDHTNEKRILIQKDDLLFASMGVGSLGRLSFIDKDVDNCTTDGTIRIFRTKAEFKNTNIEIPTMLYLTSKFGQELIYKYVIGSTGIISISKENVENLIIPKVSNKVSNHITELVLDSQNLKSKSEQLLEIAKRSVEIAIEQNEETALNFITQSMAL